MNFPAVNGVFHLYWEETGTPSTSIEISNPDTTFVTEYTIGMKRDFLINTTAMNLFQNSKVHSGPPGTPHIPPGPATATLANLPDSLDIYFVHRLVEAANGYGTYSTTSETFRTMVAGDDPYLVRKFETTPDTIYWFEKQNDFSNPSNMVPSGQKSNQKQALGTVETLNYLHNDRQIYPNHRRLEIYTETEPEWLIAQNRNMDQEIEFQYATGLPNPESSTTPIGGGFGGIPRWKNAYAHYQYTTSLGTKIGEMVQAITKARDPPGQNISALCVNLDGSKPEILKVVYSFRLLLNPGTDPW